MQRILRIKLQQIKLTKTILFQDGEIPLKLDLVLQQKPPIQMEPTKPIPLETEYIPTIREFPKAMKRILTNWLITCNNISAVFYILGASAYITFLAKYLEVQYSTSAAGGTVIAGTLIYMHLYQFTLAILRYIFLRDNV